MSNWALSPTALTFMSSFMSNWISSEDRDHIKGGGYPYLMYKEGLWSEQAPLQIVATGLPV